MPLSTESALAATGTTTTRVVLPVSEGPPDVELRVFQASGGSRNVQLTSGVSPEFMMHRVA
jgi:hypothetical protein